MTNEIGDFGFQNYKVWKGLDISPHLLRTSAASTTAIEKSAQNLCDYLKCQFRSRYHDAVLSLRIKSAARSAIIIVGRLVLALGMRGITEASMTRKFVTPRTRHEGSTTAVRLSTRPIEHVPTGCAIGAAASSSS